MRTAVFQLFLSIGAVALLQASSYAQLSPQIGWQAILSTDSHRVAGTVTIQDEDTLRVDDFTYDGGGGAVYFYLGKVETDTDFESGRRIGSLLSGTVFNGAQGPLSVDLPLGETLDGYHAFSVWCEARAVNFGSGTFEPVTVPEPASVWLLVMASAAVCLRSRPKALRDSKHIDTLDTSEIDRA